jgi:arginase
MDTHKKVAVVGVPLDLGQSRRGVDMGPSAIRYAGLDERLTALGVEVDDRGNIDAELPEIAAMRDEKLRYLPAILASCSQLADEVARAVADGSTPLVLGGDHSIAMGTLAGLHKSYGAGGVLWVDAHGDLNRPETSPSGNVHGMPLATAIGAANFAFGDLQSPPWVDPERVAIVGARSLDPGERRLIRDRGISVFTMSDIDRRGIARVMQDALDVVSGEGYVHLSLDIDACDPEIAPGVGTPVRGGLSYREAHLAMELVAESDMFRSMEVVELNPILDHADETALLAVELVASALGARIL